MKNAIKITFRASQSKPGAGTLVWQITRRRITKTISTSCELSDDEWDNDRQRTVCPKKTSLQRAEELAAINHKLDKELQVIHKTAESLETCGDYSSQDLADRFRQQRRGQPFCKYIDRIAENLRKDGKFGTAHAYQYAAVSFLKFREGKDIGLEKIDSLVIKSYEYYLKTTEKSLGAISCYMRSLRAAYNCAIKEKAFTPEKANLKPFDGVFTGNAKTKKRALSAESILKLKELNLEESKPAAPSITQLFNYSTLHLSPRPSPQGRGVASLSFSRDLFLFSLYTQGMSFFDMANLKTENIRNGAICYTRKKTGQQITVHLEDCMKKIIERYSNSSSSYIFPVLRDYENCDALVKWQKTGSALVTCNKNLKKLARMAGVEQKTTSYVARHTWASIASQEGIPIATISRGMGHESENTTRIYISGLDFSDVERANRIILARLAM